MPPPPRPAEIRLYPWVRPAVPAGGYVVELEQTIDKGGRIDPVTRYLEVTAPRFLLPATEIHSLFPPPNAEGDFSKRLPQIALKRRTLPWERESNGEPVDRRPPWLALVVLAEGEANFLANVATEDALPADVRAALGVTETGVCDVLEVTRTVVDKVFPREDELPMLCHVRESSLQDTELAGTDDDGFVAVVISNRLPRLGHRYAAYLISLEGRFDELPDPRPPQDVIGPALAYPFEEHPGLLDAVSFESSGSSSIELGGSSPPEWASGPRAAGRAPTGRWQDAVGPDGERSRDNVVRAARGAGLVPHDIDLVRLERLIGVETIERLRFPVLAHWSFTCSGEGDFQTLMQGLDVGLLGTLPPPGNEEPAAPEKPELAPTGHIVLEHTTRRGEASSAWYRGPLAPREVRRRPPEEPPIHVADQARRIGQDGREDLSEAAAYELGRLLALSDPRFVAELQAWRRSGYHLRRAASVIDRVPGLDEIGVDRAALSSSLRLRLLEVTSADDAAALGPRVRPDDVGDLLSADDVDVIADGFGLNRAFVADVLSPSPTTEGLEREPFATTLETRLEELASDPESLSRLRVALEASVARIARAAGEEPEPGRPEPGGTERPGGREPS